MKAQAVQEELTASELSVDETSESKIVGYRIDEKQKSIQFLTLDEFTGNDILIDPEEIEEALRAVPKTLKLDKRNRRIRRGLSAFIHPLIFSGGLFVLAYVASIPLEELSTFLVFTLGFTMLCATIGVTALSSILMSMFLEKRFPNINLNYPEGLRVTKASNGFKSLISGNRFERGAPSHESLFSAIQLLNKAHEINKNLSEAKDRHEELKFAHKNKNIRVEVDELTTQIDKLQRELRETEEDAKALLLREDD